VDSKSIILLTATSTVKRWWVVIMAFRVTQKGFSKVVKVCILLCVIVSYL